MREHVGEPGDETELVAARDRDPVRHPPRLEGIGIERVGHDADLRAGEHVEPFQGRLERLDRETLGQFAQRAELGAGAERREVGVAQVDAGVEQVIGDARDEPDPVGAEDRHQRNRRSSSHGDHSRMMPAERKPPSTPRIWPVT